MSTPATLLLDHLTTPLGEVALVADEAGCLCALGFMTAHSRMESYLTAAQRVEGVSLSKVKNPHGLSHCIERYFAGECSVLEEVRVAMSGTPFQSAVWEALRSIPCGETWSYGDLARQIERPLAVRAVGLANGANPVSIVVPCHRVIGADGTLTGYGAGVERKRWLLEHEGRLQKGAQLKFF